MKSAIYLAICLSAMTLLSTPVASQSGWVMQESGTSHSLFGIHFIDSLTGWAVGGTPAGGGSVILHTSNGGNTWVTQSEGGRWTLHDVSFVDEVTGWAVGEAGEIIHTTDGGNTWTRQVSNDQHNLFGVQFIDANNGWIGGDWSTLLRTTNGGVVWTQESLATSRAIEDFEFFDADLGWFGGNFGDIFKTTDGGDTWVQQVTGVAQDLSTPTFISPQTGWACGGDHGVSGGGIILHTTDGGATWNPQPTGETNNIMDVFFVDENIGWASGGWADDESIILHTTDGGVIWEVQVEGTTSFFRRMAFVTATKGWVVGSEGTILHTTTGGVSFPPSQDPVAYYPFEGNANDESGNGRHGVVFGATPSTDRFGQINSAYHFDGDSSYIKANGIGLPTADRSVSLWFLAESPLNKHNALAYGGSTCGHSWMQGLDIWGHQGYTVTSHCTLKELTVPYLDEPVDSWHHWVVTTDDLGTKMYIDGVFIGSNDVYFNDTHTFQGDLAFGTAVNHSGFAPFTDENHDWFVGSLDDIRIYDRALSDVEILELYNESPSDPLAQPGVFYGTTGSSEPNYPGYLLTIDPLIGAGTLVGPTGIPSEDGPSVRALAINSMGEMYAASFEASSDLYSLNASTGAATFIANTGLLEPGDISFDKDDILYAVDRTNILYTVDVVTGSRAVVGSTGVVLGGLAYDPTDGTMYGSGREDDIYTIDLTTGLATLVGYTGLGGNIPDILFDQDGNLFGSKLGAGSNYDLIAIDKHTGSGSIVGSIGYTAVIGLSTRLVYSPPPPDPLAQFGVCYGSTGSAEPNNPGALISIDPVTGDGTLIGPTGITGDGGPGVRALAIKSTGEVYAMSHTGSSDLYSVNASTGAGTFVANTGLLRPGDICFDADDVLYGVDDTNILYTIDETTGTRAVVGSTGVTLNGLAYDPTDGTMYGSGVSDDIYTIDLETGAATLLGSTGLGGNTPDIHFDQAGNLFGAKRGVGGIYNYIAIDKVTGAGTVIGSTGFIAVVGLATRLEPPPRIPCDEITNFQARCRAGGTMQARLTLANTNYTGELVEFSIDGVPYQVTVGPNGRASLSVGVFDVGMHTVEVTVPAGCVDPVTVSCPGGIALEGGDFWNDEISWEIPAATTLVGNYPNPFNPSTTFRYGLSDPEQVSIKVYNMLGQLVRTVVDDFQGEGYHEAVWDGRNESGATVASGIYVYRMTAGPFVETKKLILMK